MLTRIRLLALALVAATFTLTALDGAQASRFAIGIKHVAPLSMGWPNRSRIHRRDAV